MKKFRIITTLLIGIVLLTASGVDAFANTSQNREALQPGRQDFVARYSGGMSHASFGGYDWIVSTFPDDFFLDNYLAIFTIVQPSTSLDVIVDRVMDNGDIVLARHPQRDSVVGHAITSWTFVVELNNSFQPNEFNVMHCGGNGEAVPWRMWDTDTEITIYALDVSHLERLTTEPSWRQYVIRHDITPAEYNALLTLENVREFRRVYETVYVIKNDGSLWALRSGFVPRAVTSFWIMDNAAKILEDSSAICNDGILWRWDWQTRQISPLMENVAWAHGHLIITQDGGLYSWGPNRYGQVGDGTRHFRYSPVRILDDVKEALYSPRLNHRLALTYDGKLWAWGRNNQGQLGDGTTEDRTVPVVIAENAQEIPIPSNLTRWYDTYASLNTASFPIPQEEMLQRSAWLGHNFALTESGELWTRRERPQSGIFGTTGISYNPTIYRTVNSPLNFRPTFQLAHAPFSEPPQRTIAARLIAENVRHVTNTHVLFEDSTLWRMERERAVSSEADNIAFTQTADYVPDDVIGWHSSQLFTETAEILPNVIHVSSSNGVYAAITADDGLYTWGANGRGQLGDGTTEHRDTPLRILDNVRVVTIRDQFSTAITHDGALYTWGRNATRQPIEDGGDIVSIDVHVHIQTQLILRPLRIMENVRTISMLSNVREFYAITNDNELLRVTGDEAIHIMDNVYMIVHNSHGFAAIDTEGRLWTWAGNRDRIGLGTSYPTLVMENVTQVMFRNEAVLVLTAANELWGWGSNANGHLGDGTTTPRTRKNPVLILEDVSGLPMGSGREFAALTNDNTLWAWGFRDNAALGEIVSDSPFAPVRVLQDVIYVTSRFAITSNGTLWDWRGRF